VHERFTSFDGTGIAFQRWSGTADGRPPVLLHHGFAADGNLNWVAPGVVGALQTDGREVIAVDARGHGESDKPHDAASYGESKMARDVSGLLDHLDIEQFDLAGYSMGAIVSLLVAASEPRLRRLVIGGIGGAVTKLGGRDTRVVDRAVLREALTTEDPGEITHQRAVEFRRFADSTGADRLALAAQVEAAHRDPIALDRINAPTLLLVGDADELAARPELLAAAIPGARLEVVNGTHLSAVGAPRFAPAIVEFLA
jgi:pimeloyl-ACP methyl ester carboxylesterase